MRQTLVKHLGDARIEVVFHDKHASLRLCGSVTLGEIAATLEEVSTYYADRPVAVDVTLDGPGWRKLGGEEERKFQVE